jgi:predicted ester cyclase
MSTESPKAIVRRMVEQSMIKGDVDAALAAYDPNFIYHNPVLKSMPGVDCVTAVRMLTEGARAAFPDLRYTIEAVIGDGEMVAVLYSWQGTHLSSLGGVPATGQTVSATGAIACRVAGGRIVEQWDIDDRLDVMEQLGLLPRPGVTVASS